MFANSHIQDLFTRSSRLHGRRSLGYGLNRFCVASHDGPAKHDSGILGFEPSRMMRIYPQASHKSPIKGCSSNPSGVSAGVHRKVDLQQVVVVGAEAEKWLDKLPR